MGNPLLARRTVGGDILITDDVTPIRVAWTDLRASDGHTIRIEWDARVACVDSPADRQLLTESFLSVPGATLTASDLAAHFRRAVESDLRRAIEAATSENLLSGNDDVSLSRLLATSAGQSAFAAGLSILPPFALRIESPSRERDRRLNEVRGKLESLHSADSRRIAELDEATKLLASRSDPARAAKLLADLRLADPLDLLRAAALIEPTWSAASPHLWLVAGNRLAKIDVTQRAIDTHGTVDLGESLGPLRSIRSATIGNDPVLLLGARDGVFVVHRDTRKTLATLRYESGTEFGFNSACYLPDRDLLVATHSVAGVVAWSMSSPDASPQVWAQENCRSLVADGVRAVLVVDGILASFAPATGLQVTPTKAAGVMRNDDASFVVHIAAGDLQLGTWAELEQGSVPTVYAGSAVTSIGLIDVAGITRCVCALAAGGLRLVDFAGAPTLTIGSSAMPARMLATRPGFVAAVTTDRSRLLLVDLADPVSTVRELHVTAVLGNRIADTCFA